MIYNQGFEIILGGKKYFAFSFYEKRGKEILSECCNTFPGKCFIVTLFKNE